MDSDSLEKLPLPKSINYTDEELEVHRRFIEDDNEEARAINDSASGTGSSGGASGGSGWYSSLKPFMSLKIILVLILLAALISSTYFYDFLNTIKYLNEQPMKIRITQLVLFIGLGYCTQYM
jgi:hypothetical protein